MAPTSCRASLFSSIFLSFIATLVLLLITFRPQFVSAVQGTGLSSPAPLYLPHGPYVFREWPLISDFSPSADEAWDQTLLTPNGGFLSVGPNQTADKDWGISMFHALHCLKMLRVVAGTSEMIRMADGAGGGDKNKGQLGTSPDMHMSPGHVGHCVGYLAQV